MTLTNRELMVLGLLSDGLYATEVAKQINFSIRTVKQILHDARLKLGARTTHQAIAIAMRRGLLQ